VVDVRCGVLLPVELLRVQAMRASAKQESVEAVEADKASLVEVWQVEVMSEISPDIVSRERPRQRGTVRMEKWRNACFA